MCPTVHATFDGRVIRPDEPIALPPNTRVIITIDRETATGAPASFLQTAASLSLTGPEDWSERLEEYLYGGNPPNAE